MKPSLNFTDFSTLLLIWIVNMMRALARPPNIRLTWKTAPVGLGAARAQVSRANSTSRDKGFVRLKRLLYLFDHVIHLYFNKTPFLTFPSYFLSLLKNSYLPHSVILRILHLVLINAQYSNKSKLPFSNG